MTRQELVTQVAGHLHADQLVDAAKVVAEFSGHPAKDVTSRDKALEYCHSVVSYLLNTEDYASAAKILWTPTQFTIEPWSTQSVWHEIKAAHTLMLMGAGSMSKSYSGGVWLFLDWLRDPEYTSVFLVGPSEDHLKDNLFSHLNNLHTTASLPLPGSVSDLFIGLDPKARTGMIRGIVVPIGRRPSGRLQGRKRIPRPEPHPQFGPLSRIRFMLDEVEKIPVGIWKDINNVLSNYDGDPEGLKIITAFNPEDVAGETAKRCEPVAGWESIDLDRDYHWTSKMGWRVLRLDAARCENVIQGKVVYPGLQTKEGFDAIIRNAGGPDQPGALTMARAIFPRQGTIYSVIPSLVVSQMKGEAIWFETPADFGSADIALEGSDTGEFAHGKFGKAIGISYPPSFEMPNGRRVFFTDKHGKRTTQWLLQVLSIEEVPKGNTIVVANQIRAIAMKLGISPHRMIVDRTGNGAGVHDFLKELWSQEVMGLNSSESATKIKILAEDTQTPEDEYGRVVSELWFALKKWSIFDLLKISAPALSEKLAKQLISRRYDAGKNNKVEGKPEYKLREGESPGKADALTLLLHCVRVSSKIVPSALSSMDATTDGKDSLAGPRAPMPCRVDATNRFEDLDAPERTSSGSPYQDWLEGNG